MEEEEAVLPPEWTLSTSGLIIPPMNIQFHFASRLTAYQVTTIIFIITAYQVIIAITTITIITVITTYLQMTIIPILSLTIDFFQALLSSSASADHLSAMFDCLAVEGWQASAYLPR